jgi:hypothetical protein
MKNIEDLVSPLIQSQFPAFYNEEGPLFIEFVKSYYKWLETTGQQAYYSRNLIEYRDIDKTVDQFIVHFKETFLKDLPLSVQADERMFIRNILDLYQNKGNEQSVKLAMRALFNQDSAVYLPGQDILKSSDGTWTKPKYLEVTVSPRNTSFVNKEVVGVSTGAKAFCESVVKKRVNGKFIDVLFLSNVRGDFLYGEQVVETSNTNTINAPSVTGSLTTLDVLNGGQDFAVGDEFKVVSDNGKNAKAIVTSISSATGRVNFKIIDGGFGFSNTASVYISDKVLRYNTLTNSNTQITAFGRFENVSQQVMRVGFTSAVNAQYFAANTILFAQGNSSVANATAGIVSVTLVSNAVGTVRVNNISGNIVASNLVFKASLVDLVYNTSSNISLFTANSVIEAINATSSANALILSVSTANTTRGSLLLRPISGNVAATNTSFRLASNNATIATVNTYTSNLSFTAVVANNADITASGKLIGSNATHMGLDSVLNTFYPSSIFSYVVGSTSNSYANIDFVSSGTDATFQVGSLDNDETVLLTPDLLSSNNTGSIPFLDINLDLSPNNANATGYGFVKYPGADINTTLLNALRYNSTVIGTVASLTSINPGTDYNINPFVLVYEPDVAGYKRKDFSITISSPTKLFSVGEIVKQTSNSAAVQLNVTNFSGTAANGSPTSSFEASEYVYQSNGTSNIATGFVYSSGITGGSGTVKLYSSTGSFQNTNTNGYQLRTLTTNATANVVLVNTAVTIATTAVGQVKEGSNNSVLLVKRLSFENTFYPSNTIIGTTTGALATIASVTEQASSLPIGENADINANVQVANAVVSGVTVLDSGFGYINGENVSLEKEGSPYIVTAQTNLNKQGVGEGYFSTTRGFASSDKKILDSDYYQEYSYEIQSKVPFTKYSEVLKKIIHVAGTRMFGKVILSSDIDVSANASSKIVIS